MFFVIGSMEIGILTQPLCQNYGGLLQNYALQQVLKKAGYNPHTIDHSRREQKPELLSLLVKGLIRVRHYLVPFKYSKPKYIPNSKETSIISKNTEYFIDKYIDRTKRVCTHKVFLEIGTSKEYQAYIVGSDQCWRPEYNKSFLGEMFLDFVEKQEGIKRIAYAASFGKDRWNLPPNVIAKYSHLAKLFDLITVREDSGINLCKTYLGVDAIHVLDPTMLLLKEDYIRLIEQENEPKSPGNLFYYVLDPSTDKTLFIDSVAEQKGLTPFTVLPKYQAENRTKSDIRNHIDDCVYPSVTSWLRAFMDAEMTIVDSFHGMVFSIIFNKPFWVIANKKRGLSRFSSMLELLRLEDRLIMDVTNSCDLNKTIDWAIVNVVLDDLRKKSLDLLYSSLNDDKN